MYHKWGDDVLKVCPSIQWTLAKHTLCKYPPIYCLIRLKAFCKSLNLFVD